MTAVFFWMGKISDFLSFRGCLCINTLVLNKSVNVGRRKKISWHIIIVAKPYRI